MMAQSRCVMRGSCGKKGFLGKPLPCPYDGPPHEPDDKSLQLLQDLCGSELTGGPVCCSSDQLETLKENFEQIEPLLSACPACRNNFRSFFCTFTCSPDQAQFLNITATQKTATGQIGVKSLDFSVAEQYGQGFFDSCKNVQYGNTNGYVMDLIGGGAKNYSSFFKFLGEEKDLGSPFQINFPSSHAPEIVPLDRVARNCGDKDLLSRCTCIDCPAVCPQMPYIPPPDQGLACQIGDMTCLSFVLIIAYSIIVIGFLVGYVVQRTFRSRRDRTYERVALSEETASPRIHTRGLVGAGSLAQYMDEASSGAQSESRHLGRGASLLDPIETVQPRLYPLNNFLRSTFYKLGLFTASYPWLTFALVFLCVGFLNSGWKKFDVETDPVRLWVAPTSESKLQKEYFDAQFGPFYRTEQIFITSAAGDAGTVSNLTRSPQAITLGNKPPVLSYDHLQYWFKVEEEIRQLKSPNGYTLRDVCFKPAGPRGACVVQSVAAWFDNDLGDYDKNTWSDRLLSCANSPVDCLPDFRQPLGPHFVLGGLPTKETGEKAYLEAEALVVTYVISDALDEKIQAVAMEWEETLKNYLLNLSSKSASRAGLEIAFSTGVSLEEELNKSTNTDVKIVVLSYLAMFLYVSLTLGSNSGVRDDDGVVISLTEWARNFPKLFVTSSIASSSISVDSRVTPRLFPRLPRSLFVGSKFTLGLFGIVLVILSVSSSVGFFSFIGVKVTLIIAEVIPFLVLAVGVDNVFILVHELDRQNLLHGANAVIQNYQNRDLAAPMSPTNSHRSPFEPAHEDDAASMPLTLPAEERVARTLAKMGPSILLSTITETVAFALGALVPMPAVRNFALYAAGSVFLNAALQVTVFISALSLDLKRTEGNRVDCFPCIRLPSRITLPSNSGSGLGRIGRFIRRYYAPFLLKPFVKGTVLTAFGGIFVASVISIQHIQLGLDQRLALPSESYLVDYFDNLDAYLDVGPPVYFVSRDIDVTGRLGQQSLCGRFSTCREDSLANRLELERKRPKSSFIAEPAASWVDDFLRWLNPSNSQCCRVRKADPSVFCAPRDSPRLCRPCYEDRQPPWNITMDGLPEDEEFMWYFKQWWQSPTTEDCPLAGQTSYGTAISLNNDGSKVEASHYRTFHTPLKNQKDFIDAFSAAQRIAADISVDIGATVFPYSMFYVFFDQYTHIIGITQEVLGLGLASVLIVTSLLLGSWRTSTIVTAVVALTVVNVMGIMSIWGISLNAISLVNLVISLGIAVEFCAHIARAFMSAGTGLPIDHPSGQKERDERMWTALVDVGPAVLCGITFTKLIGMSVLALTRSKLLEIYYFRMWLTLIISGASHGLVLLPVILSLAGGPGFPQQEADEEWMSNAIRTDYEYAPFLADEDSDSSD